MNLMPEKILIVDDDVDSLKLIGLMLQRHGYEVVAASAGSPAIQKANAEVPDLIILDVMMPDMNGYEVCRRLRANPTTTNIPIIMFTAKTLIDDKVAGFEAGADDYLTKPTHPAELASRVKAVLQRNASSGSRSSPQIEEASGLCIGVLGAKGGIGTTTLVMNMAAALKRKDEDPIVADFRLGSGSMGLYLGLGRSTGMANVLSCDPDAITSNKILEEIVTHPTGLRALLSSAHAQESLTQVSNEVVIKVVDTLKSIGVTVIFDLGSGITPLIDPLITQMDKLVIVIDPTGISLAMAGELLTNFVQRSDIMKSRINIVVVNRVQNSLQPAWHEVEQILNHEITSIIAAAPELAYQASEASTPMVFYQPNAIVSNQYVKLTEDLLKEALSSLNEQTS